MLPYCTVFTNMASSTSAIENTEANRVMYNSLVTETELKYQAERKAKAALEEQ